MNPQRAYESVISWIDSGTNLFSQFGSSQAGLLKQIEAQQKSWQQSKAPLVVCGTGGSALGARALNGALAGKIKSAAEVLVLDELDPDVFRHQIERLAGQYSHTHFLIVSKSGETIETLAQFLTLLEIAKPANQANQALQNKFTILTQPGNSSLSKLAEQHNFQTIDHPMEVGGRFSIFSIVGLLPAACAGVDVKSFLRGATSAIDAFKSDSQAIAALAQTEAATIKQGIYNRIVLVYNSELQALGWWFRQLWGESLGKQGMGSQPVIAYGPSDHHSQLQLWLAGPQINRFLVFSHADFVSSPLPNITTPKGQQARLDLVLDKARAATLTVLARHDVAITKYHLPKRDAFVIGELMMNLVLETLLASAMLEINPFDQPAVEEGKLLTLASLAQKP